MVPTEGQRNQVVPSSHARQGPNYACFDAIVCLLALGMGIYMLFEK